MSDINNQAQVRTHKRNVGAVQGLAKQLEILEKDQRKSLQSIDQEILEAQKFLETILSCSGNSVSYEEAFGEEKAKRRKTLADASTNKYRPTKSSLFKMEVQLRKSLDEARFKINCEKFFQRWKETFEKDI